MDLGSFGYVNMTLFRLDQAHSLYVRLVLSQSYMLTTGYMSRSEIEVPTAILHIGQAPHLTDASAEVKLREPTRA